jgi:hypothetical protein
MTRFLCIYKPAKAEGTPPTTDEQAKMGAFIEKCAQAGVLLSAEGCLPSSYGFRVRQDKGKVIVTDGPFTESKELVGGMAIIQTVSREEAVPWIKEFVATAGDGECEVRQLWDQPTS